MRPVQGLMSNLHHMSIFIPSLVFFMDKGSSMKMKHCGMPITFSQDGNTSSHTITEVKHFELNQFPDG